ncbi:hypothetical protein L7F22_066322 [Adiantum nelumboides]|nr:hypothetical protein [Adiantum nelumboides]
MARFEDAMARFCASERALKQAVGTLTVALVATLLAVAAVGLSARELRPWARPFLFACSYFIITFLCATCLLLVELRHVRRNARSTTESMNSVVLQPPPSVAITINSPETLHAPAIIRIINRDLERQLQELPRLRFAEACGRLGEDGHRELECAVCLETFEGQDEVSVLPPCNHVFHVRCIKKWLPVKLSCPLCRQHPDFARRSGGAGPSCSASATNYSSATLDIN